MACSRRALESLVIPAIADLQHEHGEVAARGRWVRAQVLVRGYLGLFAALALHLAACPARHVRENWIGRQAPGWRLVRPLIPRAAVVALVLTTVALLDHVGWGRAFRAGGASLVVRWGLALLPSVLALTIPAAILVGLVLALRRLTAASAASDEARRWTAPATGVSVAAAVAMFVLFGWLVPVANQSFREMVFATMVQPPRPLAKGSRELTLPELTVRLREGDSEGRVQRALALEWHKKLALPLACIALGPLAVGLVSRNRGRIWTAGSTWLVLQAFYGAPRIGHGAAQAGHISPALGAWAAAMLPVVVAFLMLAARPAADRART